MKADRHTSALFRARALPALFALLIVTSVATEPVNAASVAESYSVIRSQTKPAGGRVCGLFESSDGFLYGASEAGGERFEGMVFKMNRDGSDFVLLHSFTGDGLDEKAPQGLIEGTDGDLYGTTRNGGLSGGVGELAGIPGFGNGAVFRLSRDGTGYQVLHRFTGAVGDGSQPWAGVVEGKDGALYGTTLESGMMLDGQLFPGPGVIYKLNKDGTGYQVLHVFLSVANDGARSFAGLLAASDGALYGVTDGGGNSGGGNGVVFRISQDGSQYSILHSFPDKQDDGRMPRSQLIEGIGGVLFGTTQSGGTNDHGTVFKLNKDGSGYQVIHRFLGQGQDIVDPAGRVDAVINGIPTKMSSTGDGAGPVALVQANNGTLYGTTESLGRNGAGTLFKLKPDGSGFAVVHHFNSSDADGQGANGALALGSGGNIYGATWDGGLQRLGTVFKVAVPAR